MKEKSVKKGHRVMWGFIYVFAFLLVFVVGAVSKFTGVSMGAAYDTKWDDSMGTIRTDIADAFSGSLSHNAVGRDTVNAVRSLTGVVGAEFGVRHQRAVGIGHY